MVENRFGALVREEWLRAASIRPNVELDEFVIMPNHLHGIVIINTPGVVRPGGSLLRTYTR
jgi:REP element-mobilizing transposase RayT